MGYNESDDTGATRDLQAQVLAQAQKYDPNAKLGASWAPEYDRSKLPKWSGGDPKAYDKYGGLISLSENMAGDRVKNPAGVIHDANYGDYTVRSNVTQAEGDKATGAMGALEKYMPAVISMVMAAGLGVGAGPALGGLIGSGMSAGRSLSMGDGVSLQSLLSSLAGMTGIPGAGFLSNFIMQEMQKQKSGGG